MRIVTAAEIDSALSYPALVDVLAQAFLTGAIAPPRHHHTMKLPGGAPDATLLLMPAWTASAPGAETAGRYLGLKTVSVFPGNGARGLPAVQGAYLLMSAETGEPLALIDAPRLTAWRTAAASALAARHLARPDASRLAVVGAGALGPFLVRAHASVRPIRKVEVWNRTRAAAERMVASLANTGLEVAVAGDLEDAVRRADIVSTATLSPIPLVHGAWLAQGTHLDCVGAFKPDMRETDDEVVRRARIWVDTYAGGLAEAGDIVMPLAAGVITREKIEGELADLVRTGPAVPRASSDITMFKSVGASIEDLAAAIAVYEALPQAEATRRDRAPSFCP
jgi:ornithine cyclodeaminase/alanine dehydrogenase-like protein (mu-crystallin family)